MVDERIEHRAKLVRWFAAFVGMYDSGEDGELWHEEAMLQEVLVELRTDYRALLKAYMDHVIDRESVSYLGQVHPYDPEWDDREPIISQEQLVILKEIEHELDVDGKNGYVTNRRSRP